MRASNRIVLFLFLAGTSARTRCSNGPLQDLEQTLAQEIKAKEKKAP